MSIVERQWDYQQRLAESIGGSHPRKQTGGFRDFVGRNTSYPMARNTGTMPATRGSSQAIGRHSAVMRTNTQSSQGASHYHFVPTSGKRKGVNFQGSKLTKYDHGRMSAKQVKTNPTELLKQAQCKSTLSPQIEQRFESLEMNGIIRDYAND